MHSLLFLTSREMAHHDDVHVGLGLAGAGALERQSDAEPACDASRGPITGYSDKPTRDRQRVKLTLASAQIDDSGANHDDDDDRLSSTRAARLTQTARRAARASLVARATMY